MFTGLGKIGLAVGPEKVTVLWLNKRRQGYEIKKYGCIDIPAEPINGGIINNPVKLGQLIKILVEQLGLKGQKIATAISGPQMYMRIITVPRMKLKDLKAAAYYQASMFLPVPIEEIVMDVHPLRYFQDKGNNWCELYFLAVPKQSVQNLKNAFEIAGLKLGAVEIEPLSLIRAWGGDTKGVLALLYLTNSKSNISVFRDGAPVFNRIIDHADTSSVFTSMKSHQSLSGPKSSPDVFNITRIIRELTVAQEYYKLQAPPEAEKIGKIILCGQADLGKLKATLEEKEVIDVQIMDLVTQLKYGEKTPEQLVSQLGRDYPVAFGLAVRRAIK